MKSVFLGLFFAVAVLGFVGCSDYDEENDLNIREQCLQEPSLPICQDNRDDEESNGDTEQGF